MISTYNYDPFGRRLWKEVNGVRTYFVYADEGLVAEVDAAGNVIKSYGYRPGSVWTADPQFMKVGGQYYFYHNDQLGTPQKMTAVNGAVVWSAKYSSFGDAEVNPSSTVENNLRFPGQYYDNETRLHYNFYRTYNPISGRYLRSDPIGIQKGNNHLYAYSGSNPTNSIDPKGLCKWSGTFSILGFSSGTGGGATGLLQIKPKCCNGKEAGGEYVWTAAGAMPGPSVISASFSSVELSGPDTPSKSDPVGIFQYTGASAGIGAGPGWSHIYSGRLEARGFAWVFGWDIGLDAIVGKTWDNGGVYEKDCCDT